MPSATAAPCAGPGRVAVLELPDQEPGVGSEPLPSPRSRMDRRACSCHGPYGPGPSSGLALCGPPAKMRPLNRCQAQPRPHHGGGGQEQDGDLQPRCSSIHLLTASARCSTAPSTLRSVSTRMAAFRLLPQGAFPRIVSGSDPPPWRWPPSGRCIEGTRAGTRSVGRRFPTAAHKVPISSSLAHRRRVRRYAAAVPAMFRRGRSYLYLDQHTASG